MWTREPYTAISKRCNPLRAIIGFISVALLVSSCVVTDEIEFYDKINMPPRLESAVPATDTLHVVEDSMEQDFVVTVWDPDENDAESYEGVITVIEESNGIQTRKTSDDSCTRSVDVPDSKKYEGGILVTFECTGDFSLNSAPVETTVIVEVDVSDRGFLGGVRDEVVDGANSLRVTWAFESRPATAN